MCLRLLYYFYCLRRRNLKFKRTFKDTMYLLIVFFISGVNCVTFSENEIDSNQIGRGACSNCNDYLEANELTELRLEFIKQQILKKLRLSRKPEVDVGSLPAPVMDGYTMYSEPEHQSEFDDYYGRTEQKIIFPIEGANACLASGRYPSTCLQFELPADLQPTDVSRVELWFFKEPDRLDEYNQTFVISEAAHWDKQQKFKKTKPIAIKETNIGEGWVRVELAWAVRVWLEQQERHHSLHVACRTCQARRAPLSLNARHRRPFLVLYTKYAAKKRSQRHLDCGPGVSECCREPLYVNFADLGWDDWIIRPAGYHAYFCKGTCAPISAVVQSASYHHSIIRKYFYAVTNHATSEFKPCCAPTSFSSLQLLYMDSNNTITQKTLPNMVVETCGCM